MPIFKYATEEERLEARRATVRKSRAKLRLQVIEALGGPMCVCCGETRALFLTIDHKNSDAHIDRDNLRYRDGRAAWRRALREPECFQVLCFNCNSGRALNGGICPHVT